MKTLQGKCMSNIAPPGENRRDSSIVILAIDRKADDFTEPS